MHVITRKALTEFWRIHPKAEAPLRTWLKLISKHAYMNLAELKQAFSTVDYVPIDRGYYIFNIGGNNYRLVSAIHFNRQKVYVRYVLTHAEYSRGDWKK